MNRFLSALTWVLVGMLVASVIALALEPAPIAIKHAGLKLWWNAQKASVTLIFKIEKGRDWRKPNAVEYVRCGGTLIRGQEVLSASHCFEGEWKPELAIVEGWDGSRANGVRLTRDDSERDIALLHIDHPIKNAVPADVSEDYAYGDAVILVGATDGVNEHTSYGHISDIWPDTTMTNCDPSEKVGTKKQTYLIIDGIMWSGNSGGGVFDSDGHLIGVVTRMHTTNIGECKQPDDKDRQYREVLLDVGGPLWGYAVAGKEIIKFIREAGL